MRITAIHLAAAMAFVVFVASGSTGLLLYKFAMEEKKYSILNIVNVAATIIESIAVFDERFSADDHPDGSSAATFSIIKAAFERIEPLKLHSELFAARLSHGDTVEIIAHKPVVGEDHNEITKPGSVFVDLIEQSKNHQTDIAILPVSEDCYGIVAYQYIPILDLVVLGIVPLEDIRAPLISAIILSLGVTLPFGIIGIWFVYNRTSRIIDQLKDSEIKFAEFAQGTSEWFWQQDSDLRFTSITNAHPLKVSSEGGAVEYQSVIGKRREDTVDEDTDTPKWHSHFDDLKNHRAFRNFAFKFLRADGAPAYVSISGSPVFNKKGKFLGYRGTGRDLTEDREKTSALLLAEERLRVAFEAVTCGIIIIDREGMIKSVNPQARQMFGYTETEMLGGNVSMLMSGDHAAHHDRYITNYIEAGDAKIIGIGREVSGSRKDGSEYPLFLGIGEMNLDGDRQFIASLTDLTTQRNIEFQLRRAQKMDAMGQLTGGLAHDFNSLLGIIVGNLELAQRKAADIPAIARNLDRALTAAGRGTNLTRRLLNFSRQTPTDLSAVDLNEVVSEFRNLAAQSVLGQTELQIYLDPSAPEVLCNQSDLEDALLNISINARDAMPDGGRLIIETDTYEVSPEGTLVAAGLAPGHYGTLTLSDTGIGMSPEIQERIFEPFFTTKAAGKGTGLGMPMVYGFVQRSNGHVAIYSEQGLGTTIRLYLPVAEEIRRETVPDLTDASKTAPPRGTEKILIVDDEAGLREIAEATLSELGYRTAMAENGDVALRILRSIPDIDLLFTDLEMPGSINGLQLAETIQKERPDLKVLLTSGFSGQIMDKESAGRWVGSLLSKPYTNAKLAQAIRSKLDQDT